MIHETLASFNTKRSLWKKAYGAVLLTTTTLDMLFHGSLEGEGQAAIAPLPRVVNTPSDNALTSGNVALGRLLFWDPILSGNKDVACVTCHHPRFGYAENRDLSIGVNGVGLGDNRRFAPGNSIPFVKRNS